LQSFLNAPCTLDQLKSDECQPIPPQDISSTKCPKYPTRKLEDDTDPEHVWLPSWAEVSTRHCARADFGSFFCNNSSAPHPTISINCMLNSKVLILRR